MIYVIILGIVVVSIIITLFFENVTVFISLLTAISAFVLGIYQLSKDKRQIEFRIFFADSSPPKGLGDITIINTGYLPVYFSGEHSIETKQYITVYSYKKINIFKKFLNSLNRKWYSPFKDKAFMNSEAFINNASFIIKDNETDKSSNNSSFVINSGSFFHHNFNSWDYKDFFKKGESFFITDGIGNIFYLKQESIDAIKKVLKKYEK